jgi:eukaryotic-like serine/threonine-protein kinase
VKKNFTPSQQPRLAQFSTLELSSRLIKTVGAFSTSATARHRLRKKSRIGGRRIVSQDLTSISHVSAAELKVGERIAGRYRIDALLGVGGMGVVYRAHDEQLGIDIALKLLRPELASKPEAFDRFRQELLMARKVSSPHVVRIHDLVSDNARWLISMDYVAGQSLEQHLDTHSALSQQDALRIARHIALGLSAAHASGIVHRDLKPANVMLRDDGNALISDFGIALSTSATRMTGTGVLVGTPDYVSPEQARAEDVGPRSDLYTLGLILYEMLSGKGAWQGRTAAESMAARQIKKPIAIRKIKPDVSVWVERLVSRLLEPNPLRRLRDADAVVAALDAEHIGRAPPPLRWIATAFISIGLLSFGSWWVYQNGFSLNVASRNAEPSLDLIVAPLIANQENSDLSQGISALINHSLFSTDIALSDQRRVHHSLQRLGFEPAMIPQFSQRVLTDLGAQRLLNGSLEQRNDLYVITLQVHEKNKPVQTVRSEPVSASSLALAVRDLLSKLGIESSSMEIATVWPNKLEAVSAYGEGLRLGDSKEGFAALNRATQIEPRFAAAWWYQLQMARQRLPSQDMSAMVTVARKAMYSVRGYDAERVRALMDLIEGNPQQAVQSLQPLAAKHPQDHGTRLVLAEAIEASGDRPAAEKILAALTSSDPQNADAWLLHGQMTIRAGDMQRAVDDYLLRARTLFIRVADKRGHSDTLNALGAGLDRLGKSDAAVDYFTDAANIRESIGNQRGAASSRRNLAWSYAIGGNFSAADSEITKARALIADMNDSALQADIANDAGLIAEERGDFKAALPYFQEVLTLRESQADAMGVAEASLNIGFAMLHTGNFKDASMHLEYGERTFVANDDRAGIVRSLQLLAVVNLARGEFDIARQRLQRAITLAEEVNLSEERAVLYLDTAELERMQNNFAKALSDGNKALLSFKQRKDTRGIIEAQLSIAASYRDAGNWPNVETTLAAIAVADIYNMEQAALVAVRQGELSLHKKEFAKALASAEKALADAHVAHSVSAQASVHLLLTKIYLNQKKLELAGKQLKLAKAALVEYPAFSLQREYAKLNDALRMQKTEKLSVQKSDQAFVEK